MKQRGPLWPLGMNHRNSFLQFATHTLKSHKWTMQIRVAVLCARAHCQEATCTQLLLLPEGPGIATKSWPTTAMVLLPAESKNKQGAKPPFPPLLLRHAKNWDGFLPYTSEHFWESTIKASNTSKSVFFTWITLLTVPNWLVTTG